MLRDQGLVNFHLDVLGPKDHLPEYYELCLRTIDELNMGEYITFHGTVNVRAMLDRFDLLLMPSYNEGQPIVALEAMAASVPLVSTDVGGMSQLIDDVLVARLVTAVSSPSRVILRASRPLCAPSWKSPVSMNATA